VCGFAADVDDHWPPLSVRLEGYLLPICQPCNDSIGAKEPVDLRKRIATGRDQLKETQSNRYDPTWNAESYLEQLDRNSELMWVFNKAEFIKHCLSKHLALSLSNINDNRIAAIKETAIVSYEKKVELRHIMTFMPELKPGEIRRKGIVDTMLELWDKKYASPALTEESDDE
jgi:hypothetical protein